MQTWFVYLNADGEKRACSSRIVTAPAPNTDTVIEKPLDKSDDLTVWWKAQFDKLGIVYEESGDIAPPYEWHENSDGSVRVRQW